jgi:transcriptional regulator with XRE-family HTH domain
MMKHNLKALREARGWNQQQAADAFGMSKSGYIKIEHSERGLSPEFAIKAAGEYNVSVSHVMGLPDSVPVVGYAGAGSELHYYDLADTPWGEATMPPGGNEKTVAIQIRGTSLGSHLDGWYAYYDNVQAPPDDRSLRRMCVVGLDDGRVLIKTIVPGTKKGHFHLLSPDSTMVEDVIVKWAAVVKAYAPH